MNMMTRTLHISISDILNVDIRLQDLTAVLYIPTCALLEAQSRPIGPKKTGFTCDAKTCCCR